LDTKDLKNSDSTFQGQFSDPPLELYTPYEYFKLFCDDNIIDNLVKLIYIREKKL
jgi:hypothetical protein